MSTSKTPSDEEVACLALIVKTLAPLTRAEYVNLLEIAREPAS